MTVISKFVLHVQGEEQAARHPKGESAYINKGVGLGTGEVAQGDFQVVLEHNVLVYGGVVANSMPHRNTLNLCR
jgi:hypothetical protein